MSKIIGEENKFTINEQIFIDLIDYVYEKSKS